MAEDLFASGVCVPPRLLSVKLEINIQNTWLCFSGKKGGLQAELFNMFFFVFFAHYEQQKKTVNTCNSYSYLKRYFIIKTV